MSTPDHQEGPDTETSRPSRPTMESLGIAAAEDDVRFRINFGLENFNDAFAAYLTLQNVDPRAVDLIDRVQGDFLSSYLSARDCCNEQLEMLGWSEKLRELRSAEGIPEPLLDWNYAAVWDQINEVWDVVQREGRIYLFAR